MSHGPGPRRPWDGRIRMAAAVVVVADDASHTGRRARITLACGHFVVRDTPHQPGPRPVANYGAYVCEACP